MKAEGLLAPTQTFRQFLLERFAGGNTSGFDPLSVPCYLLGSDCWPAAMSHQIFEDSDSIFIPQEARGRPIAGFPKSARLTHVLQAAGIQLIGELHGRTYSGFAGVPNCGQKTLQELRALVRALQLRQSAPSLTRISAASMRPRQADCFLVAKGAELLNPFELPISQRLDRVLWSKGIAHLADLQRLPFSELLQVKGCGRKVIEELVRLLERVAAGEFQPQTAAFFPSQIGELLRSIDTLVAELSPRNQNILFLRLGATDSRARTLEEVGSRFKLTRERVRQIVEKSLTAIRKEGGPRLIAQLRGVAAICRETVCPMTPDLLRQWQGQSAGEDRFSLGFYLRLLSELNPEIPVWLE